MEESVGQERPKLRIFEAVPSRVKWLIYLSSFGTVGYGYFFIAVSAYLIEAGLTSSDVGLILGVNGLTAVLFAVPIGRLADKRGRRYVLIFGLAATTPILLVYAFTIEIVYLVAASVLAGLTEAAFMGSWNALIADQTTVENRSEAFSLSFIVGNASFGIGFALPLIFPPLSSWTGMSSQTVHEYAFIGVALLALISPIALWYLLRDYKEDLKPSKRFLSRASRGPLLKFSGINSLIGLGAGFIIPLIPTWLYLKFNVSDSLSGPLLAVSNITIGLAAIVSSRMAKRYGIVRAIVLTQGLSTVFMLSLAYVPGAAIAAGVYLVRAALMNMASPLADSFLMGIVLKEERGVASAVNSVIWRLPNSASTIVGGILLDSGRYDVPFLIATGFYVVAIVLLYAVFKDVKPKT